MMQIKTGVTISHYEVLDKIAEGGMGVVYKAKDTQLGRTVALKFLTHALSSQPDEKQRFLREARAASKLDHVNIGAIYEADETADGQLFISMAYYEGASLKERISEGDLSVGDVIKFGKQICLGLAKAHQAQIVHRDIKPANVLITEQDEMKIVDFGLAKLLDQSRLTQTGARMGTISYMSPEQIQGVAVDAKSDLWAVGVMLYEMLTGEQPFAGEYDHAIMYSIVNEEPKPLKQFNREIPEQLIRILEKTLSKKRENRYASADEMAGDLANLESTLDTSRKLNGAYKFQTRGWVRRIAARATAAVAIVLVTLSIYIWQSREVEGSQVSIAVLPLKQMGGTDGEEWFRDSMTDALITDMTKIGGIRVIAQASIRQYKETGKTILEIGRELNATYILAGSIVRHENDIRFTARLVSVLDNQNLWAESYDRPFKNILHLQSEVALAVAGAVRVELTREEKERLEQVPEVTPEALAAYLRGLYLCSWKTEIDVTKSFSEFRKAIEIEPGFALAYAGLATAYATESAFGQLPPAEGLYNSKAAAFEALRLDPHSSEAYAALGYAGLLMERNWDAIERNFEKALELKPSNSWALQWYAFFFIARDRKEEAISTIRKAAVLDPLSPLTTALVGLIHYYARDYEKAIETFEQSLKLNPEMAVIYYWRSMAEYELLQYDKASESIGKALEFDPKDESFALRNAAAAIYWRRGERDKTQTLIEEIESEGGNAYFAYAAIGAKDKAFDAIERFLDNQYSVAFYKVAPWYDPIRSDPRFEDILNRTGLGD